MDDFTRFALDYRAQVVMIQFQSELAALQVKMESEPDGWRIYPRDLKVNINA